MPERNTTLATLTADASPKVSTADSGIVLASNPNYHTVVAGENLSKIADDHKCTANDLIQWNNLDGMTVIVGQKLKVTPPQEVAEEKQASAKATQKTAKRTNENSNHFVYYTVQSGDRLFSIGRMFNVDPYAIAQANNIYAPFIIYAGQNLIIPGTSGATPVPGGTGSQTYTVQTGDNLFRIALRFGRSMQAIAAANNIPNTGLIFVGQVLVIP